MSTFQSIFFLFWKSIRVLLLKIKVDRIFFSFVNKCLEVKLKFIPYVSPIILRHVFKKLIWKLSNGARPVEGDTEDPAKGNEYLPWKVSFLKLSSRGPSLTGKQARSPWLPASPAMREQAGRGLSPLSASPLPHCPPLPAPTTWRHGVRRTFPVHINTPLSPRMLMPHVQSEALRSPPPSPHMTA